MNPKALHKIGYGLYVVTSHDGQKRNGQIANTVFQVTAEPPKIAVAINKNNVANIMWMQGDFEGARTYFQDAARILKQTFGSNHEKTKTVLSNLQKVKAHVKKDQSGPKAIT